MYHLDFFCREDLSPSPLFIYLFIYSFILLETLCVCVHTCGFFFNPHLRLCGVCYWFERERDGGEGGGETSVWERNINRLSPVHTLTGNWARNLGTFPDWQLKPESFLCTGWCSDQLGHPARASCIFMLHLIQLWPLGVFLGWLPWPFYISPPFYFWVFSLLCGTTRCSRPM